MSFNKKLDGSGELFDFLTMRTGASLSVVLLVDGGDILASSTDSVLHCLTAISDQP